MPADARSSETLLFDTSAAIAFIDKAHEAHRAVVEAVGAAQLGLAGHAWFETYSVLTRLPGDARPTPAAVSRLLHHNFPHTRFLDERQSARLAADMSSLGISGGAVYDALIAAAAARNDLPLVTRDGRARETYRAVGALVELIR